ncbi:hypothetical protein TRIATDRAFT_49937 [Trichoderma atroviride IMI 206040]|uniref:Zn(2)-C6 fungal-type domain-containing protein n=1 Tax=Hypocrea atroviridis (strain ATCC 20476 / IMI 206040) TaxID=452589 RepID=G9NJ65_HYPAI|nr:uncharacterized protein TRIATDRAFT_49937 [Trichoderma atroviride IMI 206040]EHK48940.1 hypothetical protein TRIATDRAFT_49937 [Trichoderma atroviride IMI 206040]
MRLKRGVERASCDFCHRRKIKCDRASREKQGHSSCSPCSLRQIQCILDDADDIRLRRRRRLSSRDGDAQSLSNSSPFPSIYGGETQTISQERLQQPLPSYFPPDTEDSIPLSVDQTPDLSFIDTPFELSPESIFFLDQIFLGGGYEGSTEYHEPQIKLWVGCNLDKETFDAALHAYFDLATIHLPVIMEDAFWKDYCAGRCSPALVYAVACRGIIFTATSDSWDKQQCLATMFRQKFLEARQKATGKSAIRLDDLEALAIMVGWAYDEARSSPLDTQLGNLFLTHESLVLATLQSQMQDCDAGNSGNTDQIGPLARKEERRRLLFWHVYGLDAFHSLDQSLISRIPDGENEGISRKLPHHDTGSYLDAILSLAIIAREMLQVFMTVSTKRNGIKPQDAINMYERLDRWHNLECPVHLRRKRDGKGKLTPPAVSESTKTNFIQPLHCSLLWLLEINCYLQVEACVSRYGMRDGGPFEAEMAAHRIELESLRAVKDGMEICQWMKRFSAATGAGSAAKSHSLIDLAPFARDICAGQCFWISERGKRAIRHPTGRQRGAKAGNDHKKNDIDDYMKAAKEFRSAVATATSHRDTELVLERLDQQIASFEDLLAQ